MKNAMSSDSTCPADAALQHDGDAHFEFRRLDRHGQAPAEAGDEALLDAGDFLGIRVAGDDDLLVRLDQRVEEIEEFFLGAALVAKNWISSISSRSSER